MPNEALIQHLDTLRETTLQQQRAAAALQATFKTVVDGQNRVRRALTDYHTQNSGVDVGQAHDTFSALRLKEDTIDPLLPPLRRELKQLATAAAALKEAVAALSGEPVDVSRLNKAILGLQSAPQAGIEGVLPELRQELKVAQEALGYEFGQRLRDALAAQGIAVGARPPKFEIGRFALDANFESRFITLRYGRDMVIPRAPITIEGALKAYESAVRQVMERPQDGAAWMAQLHEAYQNVRRGRAVDEARVNIVECYVALVLLRQGRAFASEPSKRTFVDYTRAQFIYDFYEFASQQRISHRGLSVKAHVATKAQGENPARSMWIVEGDAPYDGRYIGDLEFVRE